MSDSVTSIVQVAVMGLISVIIILVLGVFNVFSLYGSIRFLYGIAQTGATAVTSLATSALSQAKSIIIGAENTLVTISGEVSNSVISGLQVIFGSISSIGNSVLDTITEGAGAITDILIELAQNITTAFINFMLPTKDVFLMYGDIFIDVINTIASAFGPIQAIINGTVLLSCCVAQSIKNFPGGPSISLPGNCSTNDCGCLCSCSACGPSPTECTCPGRGSTPCCESLF
jgi:hypothetical protein